jgi:hypothetical protein
MAGINGRNVIRSCLTIPIQFFHFLTPGESRFICFAAESASVLGLEEGLCKESVLTESDESPPDVELLLHDISNTAIAPKSILVIITE